MPLSPKFALFAKKAEKFSTLLHGIYEFSVKIEIFFKKDLIFFPYRIKIGVDFSTQTQRVPNIQHFENKFYQNKNGGIHTMKLNPLADRVVVKMVELEETTKSGIILTASAKEKTQVAEVLAVGPGELKDGARLPMSVKIGDKVVTSEYCGTKIKLEGTEYVIISESDILAIVE